MFFINIITCIPIQVVTQIKMMNLKMSTIYLLYNWLIIGEDYRGGDCSELDKQHCGHSAQMVKVTKVRGSPDVPLGESGNSTWLPVSHYSLSRYHM